MNEILRERIDIATVGIYERNVVNSGGSIMMLIHALVTAAARYWTRVDPTDFCVQMVTPDCIVFGGVNRLIWSPAHGFKPDRSYCTPAFLETCDSLGRAPGSEPHVVIGELCGAKCPDCDEATCTLARDHLLKDPDDKHAHTVCAWKEPAPISDRDRAKVNYTNARDALNDALQAIVNDTKKPGSSE